ncbi:hypothetical protein CDD81_5624 [Ophiocordyceps australis]|uniref:Peptidase S8/S53 domain-containing protein n=1 Tax=Ophiocordyceps australis TaxID=1399860 RepID=A0A2C5Y7N3_9HYPO|nr:hypothetical protein CDD81_5624 [Ophiocordyceps australis]
MVDYEHPSLGGCFGRNCIVSFGADLVNNEPTPRDCHGHGTLVSGLIAAQSNNDYGMLGAAPDAELGMYRITCTGQFTNDVWIDAIFRAHDDGATIISASSGNPGGWASSMLSEAAARLVAAGVIFVQGAGNDGATGAFTLLDPAPARGVITVGSVNNLVKPRLVAEAKYVVDGGESEPFIFWDADPMKNFTGKPMELYALRMEPNATHPTSCGALLEQVPDLSGKIVLSPLCLPAGAHLGILAAKGATQVLAYHLDKAKAPTYTIFNKPPKGIAALALIEAGVAATLLQASQAGKVVVTISPTQDSRARYFEVPEAKPGAVSSFSSWGPSFDLALKPSLMGVGGWLVSTAPKAKRPHGFTIDHGTSVSTPLVAAVVALVIEARGHVDPAAMQNLLVSHSNPQLYHNGKGFSDSLAPVGQQGGGLVRAYDAAYATTLFECEGAGLSFNDGEGSISTLEFSLHNTGNKEVEYRVSHVAALTALLFAENGTLATIPRGLETLPAAASLSFDHGNVASENATHVSFAVAPKHSQVVRVTAKPPEHLNTTRFPMWSGWVAVNGSDGSSLSLPYQGFSGSLRHHAVLRPDSAALLFNGTRVTNQTHFTLPAQDSAQPPDLCLAVETCLGSTLVHAHYVPVQPGSSHEPIGQVYGFPVSYMPSSLTSAPDLVQFTHFNLTGMMHSGKYAPEGSYKIVVRALRNFGSADKEDDWDTSQTPQFTIKYAT